MNNRLTSALLFAGAAVIGATFGAIRTRRDILEPVLPGFDRVSIPRIAMTRTQPPLTSRQAMPTIVAGEDPHRLLSFASARNDFDSIESALAVLVRRDPQEALEAVLTLPSHRQRRALEVLLREWLISAPDAAWRFAASSFPGFFTSREFAESIAATQRFDLAAQALNRLVTPEAKREASDRLFAVWSASDPSSFETWARGQTGALRSAAFAEIAATSMAQGTSLLSEWTAELGDPAANRPQWHRFASRLIELGGYNAARDAFAEFPQSDTLWPVYSLLARTDDPVATEAWLSMIQNSESRSLATISAVVFWTERDIATAARLSLQVGNPAVTRNQLIRILPRWTSQNPQAAGEFLEHSSSLDPAMRSELLNLVRGIPPKT